MSFRKNLLATYASQIYTSLVGIVIVPVYLRYMGSEAYGLVGFYAMLQAWFQLLDMGLAPTMSRQTARFNGGAISALKLRQLLRALEAIFIPVATIGSLMIIIEAPTISTSWLKVETLPPVQVLLAVQLMGLIIALRWIAGLYRSAISGFEQQVWLGRLNTSTATARFLLVLPIFELIGTTPAHFFSYQLIVALVETIILIRKTYSLMPAIEHHEKVGWSLTPIKGILGFSLSLAFTSAVWIFVTQSDKLLLSRYLSLSEYAHFTVAVLLASGVSVISGPLSGALLPRLSRLHAQNDHIGIENLYRSATQGMTLLVAPVALLLTMRAHSLLAHWTGNSTLADEVFPILQLYAIGNGLLAINAFPYYLQFAHGKLKLHLIGNVFFVIILLPAIAVLTNQFGAIGAGWAWVGSNIAYGALWIPIVHHQLAPRLHIKWLLEDILPILGIQFATIYLIFNWLPREMSAQVLLAVLVGGYSLAVIAGGMMSSLLRPRLLSLFHSIRSKR